MDGQRIFSRSTWLAMSFLVMSLATGCRNHQKSDPLAPMQAQGKRDFLGRQTGFVPQAPPQQPIVQASASTPAKKKGLKSLSPETEVAFAEPELDAAFDEGRTPTERDALLDSARQRYQKALKIDPRNKSALVGLARVYTLSNNRARADELYREAMRQHPKDHELAFRYAKMHMHYEDWTSALQACRTAQSLDPENLFYQKSIAFCMARNGQFQEAYTLLTSRMNEADARFFLGRILIDLDRVSEGQEQLAMVLKLNPQHDSARDTLAKLQADSGIPNANPTQQAGYQQR